MPRRIQGAFLRQVSPELRFQEGRDPAHRMQEGLQLAVMWGKHQPLMVRAKATLWKGV